jgi:hypothetical protein
MADVFCLYEQPEKDPPEDQQMGAVQTPPGEFSK